MTEKIFLEKIIAITPGHVYWKDRNGVYLGCNENMAKFFNSTIEKIIGINDHELMNSKYADQLRNMDLEVMESEIEIVKEETAMDINANECVFLSRKIPLYDNNNQVIGIIGTSVDITEYKETQKKLSDAVKKSNDEQQQSINKLANILSQITGSQIDKNLTATEYAEMMREYYESIIAVMPGHVYWQDLQLRYLGCNDEQAKNSYLSNRKDIVGKRLAELIDPKEAALIDEENRKAMQLGSNVTIEEFAVMANGPAYYLSQKVPLKDKKQKVIGLLGISLNITERIKMEQDIEKAKELAEESNRSKSEFLMNMSHDIRTPFSGILGFSELLEAKETDPEKKEMLTYISTSARKLLKLLNEIIETIKYEQPHQLKFNTILLSDLLDDCHDLILSTIKRKGLEFHIDVGHHLPSYIITDEARLKRILLNLISNATKFTDHGKVTLSVRNISQTNTAGNKTTLEFCVSDTGIGIPADKLQLIFERFNRLNTSYQGQEGTGLGLWVVKQLVDDLNGNISVSSQPGQGSTFTVTVTCKVAQRPAKTIQQLPTKTTPLIHDHLSILIVEDDPISMQYLKRLMADQFNCKIDIATNAQSAMQLANNHYNLILIDIGLPDYDGFKLTTDFIAYQSKHNLNSNIFGMTAHLDKAMRQQATVAGMIDIFIKPLDVKTCQLIKQNLTTEVRL